MIPSDGDTSEVVHPGMGSFDFPAAMISVRLVGTARATGFGLGIFPNTCRNNRLDTALSDRVPEGHGVVAAIRNQILGTTGELSGSGLDMNRIHHGARHPSFVNRCRCNDKS